MRTNLLANAWFLRVFSLAALVAMLFLMLHQPAEAACKFGDILCEVGEAAGRGVASLLLVLVQVFSFMLGWAGMFFNWAIMTTVFQFSKTFGNTKELFLAWTVLRDLANIALLFGFVYLGVRTMLDIDKFDVKRALPMLLVYAALLNFSLFAAEAMIDVSNALGSAIYQQATTIDCRDTANAIVCADQGIVGSVFQISGISTLLNGGEAFEEVWKADNVVATIGISFALMVFVIVMIGVLVAGALMLVARAITLMLLLVVSPIGFAGAVIPGLEEFSKRWWTMLINNILFAPVMVLLLMVGLKLAEGLKDWFAPGSINILDSLSSSTLNIGGIFMLFAVVIGFMIAALISAQRFGLVGSEMVVGRAMKFIGGTTGSIVATPVAFLGRQTIGKGGNITANWARTSLARSNPALARIVAGVGDKVAGQSFDVRSKLKVNIPGVKEIPKDILGAPTKPETKGYAGVRKDEEEKRVKFAEDIKATKKEKEAVEAMKKDEKKPLEAQIQALPAKHKKEAEDMKQKHVVELAKLEEPRAKLKADQKEEAGKLATAQTAQLQSVVDAIKDLEKKRDESGTLSVREELQKQIDAEKKKQVALETEHKTAREELSKKHAGELATEEANYERRRRTMEDQQTRSRKSLEEMHKSEAETLKTEMEGLNKRIREMENKGKLDYAKAREREFTFPISVAGRANKEAVEKIREKIKKGESDEDKLVKSLMKKMKESDKGEEKKEEKKDDKK